MEQEPVAGSAGEAMAFGLINQANVLSKSARETQQALVDQIEELTQLKQWAADAAVDLQKRSDAVVLNLRQQTATAVQHLESERVAFSRVRADLQTTASEAIRFAVRMETGAIGEQAKHTFAEVLPQLLRAGTAVRQNVRDTSRILLLTVFSLGMVAGLLSEYRLVVQAQNRMDDRLDLIEHYLAGQAQKTPAAITPQTPTHPGKGK